MYIIRQIFLFIVIGLVGGVTGSFQAVIIPEALSDAYCGAVCDLAARYAAQEPCNWEECEANINTMYDALEIQTPHDMTQWIRQLCALAQEISRSMSDFQKDGTAAIVHDHNFVRFCCMIAASMLFQINYDHYIETWKKHAQLSSLMEEHRQQSLALLNQVQSRFEYQAFACSLQTHYYSIHELNIVTPPVYYLPYGYLQCFSIKFMLQVLVKGYFHWNIIEQREAAGLGKKDFCPDSDQRFEEDDCGAQSQDDLHQIGMKRGRLICCYKTCKTLKMVAQDRKFEEALWNDINSRIQKFDGVGFVYSPIVLAGLVASCEDTANFLASCVLQNFGKMHGHFIYLIFSNPFTCIKQVALQAFAQHFMEEIDREQKNDWVHQYAEACAWKNVLKKQ